MATSPARPPGDDDPGDLVDLQKLWDYLGLGLSTLRRRRLLALGSFLLVMGATLAAVAILPRTYRAETKLLAERNQVMPALGNPSRTIPRDADAPTRAASETVLRRDNLLSLIEQTDLVAQWEQSRTPVLRLKDWLVAALRGPATEEEKIEALVGLLERRLSVTIGEGTVTLAVDWPEAHMAYRLAETAQQNFLEARHAAEISAISETISILESHAARVRESIAGDIERVRQAQGPHKGRGARSLLPRSRPPTPAEQELAQLKVMLLAKRRALTDLEEFRRRRLAELHTRLVEQQATYGSAHPVIRDLETSIGALSKSSPQIAELKREEQALLAEYRARGGTDPEIEEGLGSSLSLPFAPMPAGEMLDPALDYAQTHLRNSVLKYEDLMRRVDSARIELDTARAAFKYRYSVVTPAQVPKAPIKPRVAVLLAAGFVASVLFALFAAIAAEVRAGRIHEAWQIRRQLKVPVLAEVERP
ncbi:MAG: chain-length determining protein [Myxococcales bacterium]|jgi:uncharacterized protein involved in exopolysaccharide biosynthesis